MDDSSTSIASGVVRRPDPPSPAAFYGLAGEIVRTIEPHTEASAVALLVQLLVGFGNLIGRTAHFRAEGAQHFMNLFVALAGTTSKGRKGSAWARVREVLERVDADWADRCFGSGLSSGEGLIYAVRDPSDVEGGGSVLDVGVDDKRLLVHESEFASTLGALRREGNTLSPVVRNAWDTGDLRTLTRNSPLRATGAHISIVGHITSDEAVRKLDRTEIANGFGNRFLWVFSERSKCLPEGGQVPSSKVDQLGDRLRAASEFSASLREMRRDDEARTLWAREYPILSAGRPGMSGALSARGEAQTMRLACLFALLDESEVVRVDHLRAALALWEYCARSVRHIFGDGLGDTVADEILRALRESPAGLDRTAIHKLFGNHQSRTAVERALRLLLQCDLAFSERREGSGRFAEVWYAKHAKEGPSFASFAGSSALASGSSASHPRDDWGRV